MRIAVLGGGISGLAAAHRLSRVAGAAVVVFEKEDRLGGWVRSRRVAVPEGELVFEAGPRTLRPVGLAGLTTLSLVKELGLLQRVIAVPKSHPSARNRFVYYRGRLNKLPSSLAGLLTSLHLPALRSIPSALFRDLLAPRPRRSPSEWDEGDESVHSFFSRRFGSAVADNLVSAMIHGIYAGDSHHLSLRALFPSLWEAERRSRSVILGSLRKKAPDVKAEELAAGLPKELVEASVWGLQGGLSTLTDGLADRLSKSDVDVRLGARIESLERAGDGWAVSGEPFSHVVSALSAARLGDIAPSLELPHLRHNPSVSVGVVNLAFKSADLVEQRGFGYLVPQSERDPHHALGVLFDNDAMPGLDSAAGYTKLTVMMGGHYWASPSREIPGRETLIRHARDVVRRHLGITDEPAHAFGSVQRSAIPQYRRGHLARMRDLHDALLDRAPGLAIVGPSYRGVGVNDCVLAASQVASALAEGRTTTGLG